MIAARFSDIECLNFKLFAQFVSIRRVVVFHDPYDAALRWFGILHSALVRAVRDGARTTAR